MIRLPHNSPADDRAKEQNEELRRIADAAAKAWYQTATGWFALVAAITGLIAACASLWTALN
jgi:hypothetical protein